MLKASLIAKTRPNALKENIVVWEDYRITVLSNRLFRMEKNAQKNFRDGATQSVWFRDMPPQSYKVKFFDDKAVIDTGSCRLIVKKSRSACRIELDGKLLPIKNSYNLGGTYRTLDRCDGNIFHADHFNPTNEISLGEGVCSRSGVAVFDDASSLTLAENGEIINERGLGTDEYIFAFGDDYRSAVKALYLICGETPYIPRYALGNWWSRYKDYTDTEYLTLLTAFEEREIPLTVATIDMDWHYSTTVDNDFGITEKGRNTPFYGGNSGWTGYSWNKNLFPDYKKFLETIEQKNLKITLNLHPADGIRWWEDMYADMATEMGINPETAEQVKFDFTDSRFINAYFDILHKPYEKDGADFWWIDWQQGTTTNTPGLDPLWALNHYHYLDNAENHSNPLILSRYAGIGSHRYPLGFSGDTVITWKTLKYLPYFTATASNVGYTWWSHDIGGHYLGEKDNDMFLRHIQYGVFSPINRMHSSNCEILTKEPWAYDNGTGVLVERFLNLRHSMIPFLYTCSYLTTKEGKALVEPLYYEWKDNNAYKYKEAYLFGGLLVSPIVQPLKKDGYASVKTWIPEGRWTDIFTGDCYVAPKGGKEVTLLRNLESIPVLAKAGTILPLSMDKGNGVQNPVRLGVKVYQGNGAFTLYEDGRENGDTSEAFTHFEAKQQSDGKQVVRIWTEGNLGVLPEARKLRVTFEDIFEGVLTLYKNGCKQEIEKLYLNCVAVEFEFDSTAEYVIEVAFRRQSVIEMAVARAKRILTHAEGNNRYKEQVFLELKNCKSVENFVEIVNKSSLRNVIKHRLLEIV